MNSFDLQIIQYVNGYARHWRYFDEWLRCIELNDIFKGGMIVPLLWWIWFRKKEDRETKEYILSTIMMSLAALLIARLLAAALPFRLRPIHNAAIHFIMPYGVRQETLEGWSSFPSDHAVFFFALATGITFVSRRLGCFALLYTFLIICLTRIYLGFHNPTDIMAGALLGIGAGGVVYFRKIRKVLTRRALEWDKKKPEAFYVCFLLISIQMVILFSNIRDLGHHFFSFFREIGRPLL